MGFNPSVGILFIQAAGIGCVIVAHRPFQSLGRDSVHSSPTYLEKGERENGVSIPRSGFCSFKPHPATLRGAQTSRFNPSVGILFIQANPSSIFPSVQEPFQSLGRDSVHSSFNVRLTREPRWAVSIPRSGFCSFKHQRRADQRWLEDRFNPSVGILFIQARQYQSMACAQ